MNLFVVSHVQEFLDAHVSWCLFAVGFGFAVMGRALFQGVPSVDPLLPIIFLLAPRFGLWQAGMFGGTAYFVSNSVVWGGHGWWDLPMVTGAFLVGVCGWFFRGHKFLGIFVATCLYEVVVNLSYALVFGLQSLPVAIPFALTHFGSNLVFVGVGLKVLEKMEARR